MQNILTRTLSSLWRSPAIWLRWSAARHKFEYEPILRSDLFNAQQMADHGIVLARQHVLGRLSRKDALLGRLTDNQLLLERSCAALKTVQLSSRRPTPAAEWLLDNFYLIEENIRTARTHLPDGYSRELPRLAEGPSAGLPRVYDIALETIAHGDGRVDAPSLNCFIASYQTITPLALGELWAIPIMLRLALIENLRRVASRVMANRDDRNLADDWADRLIEIAERDAKNVVLTVADMARSAPPMTPSFVAELARRLQGQSAALILPMAWIEQTLSESGLTVERLVQMDAQQQSGDQVSISNSIASLRLLAATDWREFVELLSHVEQVLCTDPAGVYTNMDFATRDRYRHVVERLARHCVQSETMVAEAAIELAATPQSTGRVTGHVGYYLVAEGLPHLEQALHASVSLLERWKRLLQSAPLKFYLGPALLLTLLLAWPFLSSAYYSGTPIWCLALLAVPALVMTSRLAIGLVNWLVTLTVAPSLLPRLDYSKGIPAEARTLVVVPTLFANAGDIEALAEALEVRFLANRDANLHFALLSDFMDAPAQVMPEDAELLELARQLIEALNHKYADGQVDRFFLLHRPRQWCATERVWMGHERKRGKLAELNALLRGKGQDRFALIVGDIAPLSAVRFVITLDTDTLLPRDVARQCIGTMMHPLNHPVFDEQSGKIVSGYAILQPRVGISLPSTARSTYARLFGSDAGIDPYTRAVSDVYQDLFRNGSFIGKGIYAVDAFEQALEGCLPDNRILSHDLIEGCYARCGLLSDVQLYEEYPSRYSADAKRRHRWIRGDWQVLYWALPWAPKPQGGFAPNRLSNLARWKIFDNLRRSLEPGAFLTMLAWGWLETNEAASWTLAVVILVFLQPLLQSVLALVQKPADIPLGQHLSAALRTSGQHFMRALLSIVWLPSDALLSLDAIGRSLWRMLVSKRRLLQWQPSREVERSSGNTLPGMYKSMWIAPALALLLFAALLPSLAVLALAAPLLLVWLASPAIAWWISLPTTPVGFNPSAQDLRFLRMLSRQTWAFFDRYVSPEDNWLPPDNVQEIPKPTIAHRTSPTNMGMALLSHLAAHDFGYLSTGRLLERITAMLESMTGLERHHGHFYNWYDTQTLQPLAPRYVSTVDSGNLVGLLLTLRPGLLGLADTPLFDQRTLGGLADTLDVLQQALQDANLDDRTVLELRAKVESAIVQDTPDSFLQILDQADDLAIDPAPPSAEEVHYWLQALQAQCTDLRAERLRFTLPPAPAQAKAAKPTPSTSTSSLRQLAELDCTLWPPADQAQVQAVQRLARARIIHLEQLAELSASLSSMDFTFLYDAQRDLFSIGYNADERRLDNGYYDLLASEVRLTNFVVIAQGQLPQQAWFTLGRLLSNNRGVPVLLSWSGSMFEYLMPNLIMPSYEGTLLEQTCRAAVALQIEHGHQLGIPWGVSESGYNTLDAHFNYQYRAFGVPGLGLKRGLAEDTVIAPYASALALMVEPQAACRNLQRLAAQGSAGRYGLYEAVDYTEARLPRGQRYAVVRSFMAHHQGMSLLALTSLLLDRPMQRRFESIPAFQATVLLLQERVPKTAAPYLHAAQALATAQDAQTQENRLRVFTDPGRKRPAVQLLSNGHYHVMLSSAGGGYSRCNDIAVTRWHEDATRDNWGMFCYLRDVSSGAFWSSAHQPTLHQPESHEAIFSDARAEFRVRELDFDTHTEIVVSPEDDIELRRLHITNRGRVRRSVEITTYAEVVLAPAISDAMHPAFSNLFVQTELVPALQAIVCTRRRRSSEEAVPWMCHLLAVHGADIDAISYETDRARFIGRRAVKVVLDLAAALF
eukprot:gene5308-5191_t